MAPRTVEHLLVGGGMASAACAQTLRDEGAPGSVVIVTREADPPYHRPPLSKEYLRQGGDRRSLLVCAPERWAEREVEVMTRTSVTALDLDRRTATLSNREELAFENLLIATGAMVRRLGVEGGQLEGIHYLRAPGNAEALRQDLASSPRVLLVGGSYIGSEVAASVTAMGLDATVVMQEHVTFERAFGTGVGGRLQRVLEDHGVGVVGAEEVVELEGEDGRVARARTRGGRTLEAGVVVIGVGAVPDVTLARRAGLEIGDLGGVRTDATLLTAHDRVWAAGDMCEYDSVVHGRPMRIEHEEVAAAQGRTVARNMLGAGAPHAEVPYFFSDLADWASLEYIGPAASWEREVVRGSLEDLDATVFYLERDRVVAALSLGSSDDLEAARRLMVAGTAVDPAALGDPSHPL